MPKLVFQLAVKRLGQRIAICSSGDSNALNDFFSGFKDECLTKSNRVAGELLDPTNVHAGLSFDSAVNSN